MFILPEIRPVKWVTADDWADVSSGEWKNGIVCPMENVSTL